MMFVRPLAGKQLCKYLLSLIVCTASFKGKFGIQKPTCCKEEYLVPRPALLPRKVCLFHQIQMCSTATTDSPNAEKRII